MIHGLNNSFLYSALKLTCFFKDDLNKEINIAGTAFFIVVRGLIYLVTNRHVVDLKFKDEKYEKFSLSSAQLWGRFSGDNLQGSELLFQKEKVIFSKNALNDFACLLAPNLITALPAEFRIDHHIPENMIATESDFQNDISVCDFVAFPGYPEWYDDQGQRPIFRGGTIASDPRTNYSYKKPMGDCVAYEAFSFDGSSGSPVFALQRGIRPGAGVSFPDFRPARFIGINAGHLPAPSASHSGISYFYKSSAILKAIHDAAEGAK